MTLDRTLQSHRAKPGASKNEPDPSLEGPFRCHASGAPTMILQAVIKVTSEAEIVPHLSLVWALEVQEVKGNLGICGRHKTMMTCPYDSRKVRECSVKNFLTLYFHFDSVNPFHLDQVLEAGCGFKVGLELVEPRDGVHAVDLSVRPHRVDLAKGT